MTMNEHKVEHCGMQIHASVRVLLAAALMLATACAESPQPDPQAGGKLNPDAAPTSTVGSGDGTADDPKSGMNSTRPDSSKDLKNPE